MATSPELKLAEQLVNLTESHWFNPAIFGRYLAEQPNYTTDRIMEMVASIIYHQTSVYHRTKNHSEGHILANELMNAIEQIKELYSFNHISLPKTTKEIVAGLPKQQTQSYKYSWIHDNTINESSINVQAVI